MNPNLFLVFLGGGLGALIRELFVLVVPATEILSASIFIANMLASFFVGVLAGALAVKKISTTQSSFLSTGLMGGLSTFSTFIYEIVLTMDQMGIELLVYIFLTLVIGLAFVVLGLKIGIRIPHHS